MKKLYKSGIYKQTQFTIKGKEAFIKRVEDSKVYILRDPVKIAELEKYSHIIRFTKTDFLLTFFLGFCLLLLYFQILLLLSFRGYYGNNRFSIYVYIIINVLLHELGHAALIRFYCGFLPKIKVKWLWLLPYFSVDSTITYLLPPWRQIFVYIAGIEMNILVNQLTYYMLGTPKAIEFMFPILSLILLNLLPIGGVKTDGFNILFISIMNKMDILKPKHIYNRMCNFIIALLISIPLVRMCFLMLQKK